jgi:hypothetical protein
LEQALQYFVALISSALATASPHFSVADIRKVSLSAQKEERAPRAGPSRVRTFLSCAIRHWKRLREGLRTGEINLLALVELIDGCQANNAIAWEQFCEIVDSAARYWIRKLLKAHRFDETLDDDVLQELYRQMRDGSCRCLRHFRGTTYREFRVFMRRVAYRFARRVIAKWERLRRQEEAAIQTAGPSAREGPTEQQIENARTELLSVMPVPDQEKLIHILAHDGCHAHQSVPWLTGRNLLVTSRTVRRWRNELLSKYAHRV